MRFAHKLTLALLPILALVLAISNAVIIQRQFVQEYEAAQAAAVQNWQTTAADMQTALYTVLENAYTADHLTNYLRARSGSGAVLAEADGTQLYTALPIPVQTSELTALLQSHGEPTLRLCSGHWLMCAGTLILPCGSYTLVTSYAADSAWQMRTARLQSSLRTEVLVLFMAALFVLWFCRRLTRSLAKLEAAGREIAHGAYERRTELRGDDEIASLSRSFDEMAAAVEKKVADLQENIRSRDEFTAAFTHELKTPMTSILGYADVLRSGDIPEEARRTAADFIYRESKRMEALSGHLLELMRLGEQPPKLEPVALDTVFLQLRRALPAGKPVPQLPACPCIVQAQKELLADLLLNLIQNARRATPPDGTITVEALPADGRVTLTVRDTGCGIPPEDLPRITEAFYMVDKSRAHTQGGSGLGLALCAKIAALHGTELQFKSGAGQGTAVSLTLREAEHETE